MQDLVKAVRDHAIANYNQDGWDYVVECWEDSDILEEIGNARTPESAIRRVRKVARLLDERRREVCAEIF